MTVRQQIDPEKLQTMARSILPSTARKWARTMKRRNCREVRRAIRQTLRCIGPRGETEAWLHREPEQRAVVFERRGHEKLNHFMRWCNARTGGMSDREAIDYVRCIVPRNSIGRHAFDRWELYVRGGGRTEGKIGWRELERRDRQERYERVCRRIRRLMEERLEFCETGTKR